MLNPNLTSCNLLRTRQQNNRRTFWFKQPHSSP